MHAQTQKTLCDSHGLCPPGSSVHRIFQAKILSGLPLPTSGDLLDPGIKPASPVSPTLQAGSLPAEPSGKTSYTDQSVSYIRVSCSVLRTPRCPASMSAVTPWNWAMIDVITQSLP